MVLTEWQAVSLFHLFEMSNKGHFEDKAYTIPELCLHLMAQEKVCSESHLRKFLYELRDEGVLVVGKRVDKCGYRDAYELNPKRGRVFFYEHHEDSRLFQLSNDYMYSMIVRRF